MAMAPRSDRARKVRDVERVVLAGGSIDLAFRTVGVSEEDYLAWSAERAGVGLDSMAQLHAALRESERGIEPKQYIGAVVPGECPICGSDAGFDHYTENLRESGICRSCGSNERQRQMAFIVRHRFGLGFEGPIGLRTGATVHNTESTGALHQQLLTAPGYTFSEYWGPEHRSGEIVNCIRHEDLQALSFPDESLDLVLSSDVLEHMPDPYQAHAEIFRALRPGGAHIFTVPFNFLPEDDVRARIEDGEARYFAEKMYHGDPVRPDEGILVWTVFGAEMLDRLEAMGFHAFAWKFSNVRRGIVGWALVFEARKPLEASPLWLEHQQRSAAAYDGLSAELEIAHAELAATRAVLADREAQLQAMEASSSWRFTRPLRAIQTWRRRRPG